MHTAEMEQMRKLVRRARLTAVPSLLQSSIQFA
jgi:hypothetical protein